MLHGHVHGVMQLYSFIILFVFCGKSRGDVLLEYTIYDGNRDNSTKAAVIVSHGLFGSKKNWRTICKQMSKLGGRQVIAYDAVNHGSSSHHPQMSYSNMAEDLLNLLNSLQIEKVIPIGHSMGGKTVMMSALLYPELIEKLVVVDAAPTLSKSMGEVKTYLDKMISMDMSLYTKRKEIEKELQTVAKSPSICQFLMSNLEVTSSKEFRWRINLQAMSENYYPHIHTFPPLPPESRFDGPTLFVGGKRSYYITEAEYPEIFRRFPAAQVHHIPDAGHWVHSEKPQEFLDVVLEFIKI